MRLPVRSLLLILVDSPACEPPGEFPGYWTSEPDTRLPDYA